MLHPLSPSAAPAGARDDGRLAPAGEGGAAGPRQERPAPPGQARPQPGALPRAGSGATHHTDMVYQKTLVLKTK